MVLTLFGKRPRTRPDFIAVDIPRDAVKIFWQYVFCWQNLEKKMRYILSIVMILLVCCGCSDGIKLYPVEGTVTQESKPLINAMIEFHPQDEKGGTSYGKTDQNGHFTLDYAGGKKGAVAGKHLVRVSGGTTDLKAAQAEIELKEKMDASGPNGPPIPMPRPKPTSKKSNEPVYCEVLTKGKTVLEIKI